MITSLSSSPSLAYISLADFLEDRKQRPTSRIVVGNEAGDADSLISAIALSYVEADQAKTPLASIARSDLETQRPETLFLLQLAGISPDLLLYVDSDELLNPLLPADLQFTLVDHNRLSNNILRDRIGSPRYGNISVVEIVDHHLDEGHHSDTCTKRDIAFDPASGAASVASTCTLVAERLFQNHAPPYPADLSVLLLGTVLLDSVNLHESAGKATPRDRAAVRSLLDRTTWTELPKPTQERLGLSSNDTATSATLEPNTTALFEALQDAKFDPAFWNALSVRDALRLDYKQFTSHNNDGTTVQLGVSTVLLSLEDFAAKSHVQQGIRHFMEEHQLHVFGIMLTSQNGDGRLQRQLVLSDLADGSTVIGLVEFLLADNALQLAERPTIAASDDGGPYMRWFDQGNSKASRKQVVPILMTYYEK